MSIDDAGSVRRILLAVLVVAFAAFCARPAHGQMAVGAPPPPNPPAQAPSTAPPPTYDGYMVGVGDVLQVHVVDEDDVSGQYQVNPDGNIRLPLLSSPIHADGESTFDLSKKVGDALKSQGILRYPQVTIFILRSMSHNVTILGEVSRPGVYPLEKQNTTLLEAISMAGGLLTTAGPTVTIAHHSQGPGLKNVSADASSQPATGYQTVDVHKLMTGRNPNLNVPVQPGDVITVSRGPIVYVVGDVAKPGAFQVQDGRKGMTILQALALVGGTQSTAKLSKAVIVRQSDDGSKRETIPVNLTNVMRGKKNTPLLEANDILFVPQSGFKAGMQKAGQVAVQAASEVAGYGLGLRVGTF
jgi:polysaccharide export outer membrane protein